MTNAESAELQPQAPPAAFPLPYAKFTSALGPVGLRGISRGPEVERLVLVRQLLKLFAFLPARLIQAQGRAESQQGTGRVTRQCGRHRTISSHVSVWSTIS